MVIGDSSFQYKYDTGNSLYCFKNWRPHVCQFGSNAIIIKKMVFSAALEPSNVLGYISAFMLPLFV